MYGVIAVVTVKEQVLLPFCPVYVLRFTKSVV